VGGQVIETRQRRYPTGKYEDVEKFLKLDAKTHTHEQENTKKKKCNV
jgi:hypothetical protein